MKTVFLLLLCTAALFFLAGCKAKGNAGGSVQGELPQLLLVTDSSGENDAGFNHGAFSGILSFYKETWSNQDSRGRLYNVVRCKTQELYVPNLKEACEEKKWDIIATTGFTTTNAELSRQIIEKVNAVQSSIINKTITVIPTYRDALGAGRVPQGLLASDA
ncbi:hypothetical protein ACYULU_07405 [Breznakiellaceae bacterium SP9]